MRSTGRKPNSVANVSKSFPHPFSKMATDFRAWRRALPRRVSVLAANEFRANFRRQGLRTKGSTVEPWKPRQENKGARRSILIKTGRLRRAIKAQPTYDEARVVNNTPYAAIHNRGGKIKGEKRAYASNRKSGLARLRKSGSPATMAARPFMVSTDALMDDVSKSVMDGLQAIFKGVKA